MDEEAFLPEYKIEDVGDIQTLSQIYPQNVRDLNIPKIWKKTKGKGITVLVLDTGCPVNHPDLNANIDVTKCYSFISGEDIWDSHVGHGTHCSGTIGAADNTFGIVGVAPEVTIVTGKVLNKNGRSVGNSIDRGLAYALELKPDVVSMSLGGPNPMPQAHNIIKRLVDQNIAVVCSAGNNGEENVLYPARYDECIAVGSYSNSLLKDKSVFSSWGDSLDIMAPGEKILSTYLNQSYAVLTGTSMAAPVISGVVALLKSYHRKNGKELTVKETKDMLYNTALDIGSTGWDEKNGWGIVQPEKIFALGKTEREQPEKINIFQKLKRFFKNLF